jgi:hypothetical protein
MHARKRTELIISFLSPHLERQCPSERTLAILS